MSDLILDPKSNLVLNSYDRLSHTFITGYPSSGIATYVCKLLAQDINSHTATILVDPYGDMAERIIKENAKENSESIVHIKAGDPDPKFALNVLSNTSQNRDGVVETVVNLFYDLYDPMQTGIIGPRFEQAIRMATITVLADENPNFEKLMKVFTDDKYLQSLLTKVDDESVKSYWQNYLKQTGGTGRSEVVDYVLSKLSLLILHKQIAVSINGSKSLDLRDLINNKRTVIFDLGAITYDTKAYSVMSAIVLHLVEKAMLTKNRESDVALYIDEVHMLSTSKLSKIAMFAKRYATALTYVSSRPTALMSGQGDLSLMYECGRFGTKISFRQMSQDAENVERIFIQNKDSAIKLQTLKRFHAYIQTLKDSEIQPPVVIET